MISIKEGKTKEKQLILPLASVIVPFYNRENSIRRCLDSLINQTYKEIEIIAVDDGSTDRSLKICRDYATKDDRIRCFHKENGGVSSARNMGISYAKGDILLFVDSDDFVLPSFIEKIVDAFENSDVDVVMTKFANGNEHDNNFSEIKERITLLGNYDSIDLEKKLFSTQNWVEQCMIVCVWGKGYKRKIFDDLRFEGRYSEDDRFSDELNSRNYKVKIIDVTGYVYCYNPNSLVRDKSPQKKTAFLDILLKRLRLFANDDYVVENTCKLFCNMFIEYYFSTENLIEILL